MALRARRAGGESKPPQAASVKSRGGERCGKGPSRAGQVCDEKTNVCEPLLTHRKAKTAPKPGAIRTSGTKARPRGVLSARGRPACCPGGVRCIGGVSSLQALAWNRRTCRPDTDSAVHVADWRHPAGEREDPERQKPWRGRVPMRGTGTDRLVVVLKVL